MIKINKRIEIARTTNAKFSSMGAKSCQKIFAALSQRYEHVGISIINDRADLKRLVDKRPDLVFLGLKRVPHDEDFDEASTDIWMAQYLDEQGINYTGSTAEAMKLEFNKEKAKTLVRLFGLPTARSFVAIPGQYPSAVSLPLLFPLFIKPLYGGGGWGVDENSVARTFEEYESKIAKIYSVKASSSIVEQYLEGREFSVAILDGHEASGRALMPIEIITTKNSSGDRILSSRVKHEDHEVVKTVEDKAVRQILATLAEEIFVVLGGHDIGRIDIRMDVHGNPYFLEANLMPGPCSRYFTGAFAANIGLNHEQVLWRIVEIALSRGAGQSLVKPGGLVPFKTRPTEALAAQV